MSRFLGELVYPIVPALPPGRLGQHVMYQGVPWFHDGTTWARVGAASASTLAGRATVNVGAVPTPEFTTTVTDANVTAASMVQAWISAATPAGKDADEVEMDVIDVWCKPKAGALELRLTGQSGFIHDNFVIDYLIVKAG